MSIGSNHRDVFCSNVEIDTIHHGTEFIVRRGKHSAVYSSQQHGSFHFHPYCIIAQHSRLGKFIRILSHQAILTVLILYCDFQWIGIYLERQRLFGNLFQSIQNGFSNYGKAPVSITFIHFDRSHHCCFAVRSCDRQGSVFQFKEETIQYRQRILRINHTADSLQVAGKCSTRNDKFHIFLYLSFILYLIYNIPL